jgi:hypothetical protein
MVVQLRAGGSRPGGAARGSRRCRWGAAHARAIRDPRSKVLISDCTIFGVTIRIRYPPDLQTLIDGVNVIPRGGNPMGAGDPRVKATDVGNPELATKKKVYLRHLPIDPMTGKDDWEFRSCYDSADSGSWGGENVFDVRSKSKDTALNGRNIVTGNAMIRHGEGRHGDAERQQDTRRGDPFPVSAVSASPRPDHLVSRCLS